MKRKERKSVVSVFQPCLTNMTSSRSARELRRTRKKAHRQALNLTVLVKIAYEKEADIRYSLFN